VADTATERQAADPRCRHEAARRGQPKDVRGVVHVAPQAAALDPYGPFGGIDADATHRPEIDDQPVVTHAQAGGVVATATDRDREPLLTTEVHRDDDVGHILAACDQARVAVDHTVVNATRRLVARIARSDQCAA
jgi:hypothetical protein